MKPLLRWLGIAVTLISLAYMGLLLRQGWPQLRAVEAAPLPVLLACSLGGAGLSLSALLWERTLAALGERAPLRDALRIWFLSQISRYAPGNIWHLLGRGYLGREAGIALAPLTMSLLWELVQTLASAIVIAALALLVWEERGAWLRWCLLLLPVLILYLRPSLMEWPLRWLGRSGWGGGSTPLPRHELLRLLPGYLLMWVLYGCGLYCLIVSIHPLPLVRLPLIIGIFAAAWVAGFLSFITPSGLGVREGVLAYLLGFLLPAPLALLLALLARLWFTLSELLTTALVLLLLRAWPRRGAPLETLKG